MGIGKSLAGVRLGVAFWYRLEIFLAVFCASDGLVDFILWWKDANKTTHTLNESACIEMLL